MSTRTSAAELRDALCGMLKLWYSEHDPGTPGLKIPNAVRYAEECLSPDHDTLCERIEGRREWLEVWDNTPDNPFNDWAGALDDEIVDALERARARDLDQRLLERREARIA